jgi:hypothetical protein
MLCYRQYPHKTSFRPVKQEEEVTWKAWQAREEVGVMWQLVGHV